MLGWNSHTIMRTNSNQWYTNQWYRYDIFVGGIICVNHNDSEPVLGWCPETSSGWFWGRDLLGTARNSTRDNIRTCTCTHTRAHMHKTYTHRDVEIGQVTTLHMGGLAVPLEAGISWTSWGMGLGHDMQTKQVGGHKWWVPPQTIQTRGYLLTGAMCPWR